MQYAHTRTGSGIDILSADRPRVWKDVTGSYSGLQHASDAFLLTLGWYPLVQVDPPISPTETYEPQDVSQFTVGLTEITWTRVVRPLTQGELDARAEATAKQGRRVVPNDPNPLKPVTWRDLNKLLDTLRDQGIIV